MTPIWYKHFSSISANDPTLLSIKEFKDEILYYTKINIKQEVVDFSKKLQNQDNNQSSIFSLYNIDKGIQIVNPIENLARWQKMAE